MGRGKFQSEAVSFRQHCTLAQQLISDRCQDVEARIKACETLRPMQGSVQTPEQVKMSQALANVAAEHGSTSVTAGRQVPLLPVMPENLELFFVIVALAYVMQKTPYVFPVIGGRKVEHLKANIEDRLPGCFSRVLNRWWNSNKP